MYLSRVEIDVNNRQKIRDLTHLGAYHNWVEMSFPKEFEKGERLRHLWRLDHLYGRDYLLVLSSDKPDLNRLERYGIYGTGQTKDYVPFLNELSTNKKYRFRLTANPTRKNVHDGKVYPHVTIEQQKKWLLDKAETSGFSLSDVDFDVVSRDHATLYKGRKRIRLSRVSFEGVLEISDLNKFKETLIHGIGREKAYGMGLLTVIPLS